LRKSEPGGLEPVCEAKHERVAELWYRTRDVVFHVDRYF